MSATGLNDNIYTTKRKQHLKREDNPVPMTSCYQHCLPQCLLCSKASRVISPAFHITIPVSASVSSLSMDPDVLPYDPEMTSKCPLLESLVPSWCYYCERFWKL